MGQVTAISWCDHTFNPVRGCEKVSTGCKFCYAEGVAKRNPKVLGTWGPSGTRAVAAESYWREPLQWDAAAKAAGVRRRVFCASLADVFEDRPEWDASRLRLLELIRTTPNLDWLLLTKRPQNIRPLLERAFDSITPTPEENLAGGYAFHELEMWLASWLFAEDAAPHNVWLGTSVEDQEQADKRIPLLLSMPAVVHWLSCEPLVGPVDLASMRCNCSMATDGEVCPSCNDSGQFLPFIDWVVVGGESGVNPNIRPMHPQWAQQLRDQCKDAGVAFHFKQWGEWQPISQLGYDSSHLYKPTRNAQKLIEEGCDPGRAIDIHGEVCTVPTLDVYYGGDILYKEDNRQRLLDLIAKYPSGGRTMMMFRVGKDKSGRLLDGVQHDGLPVVDIYTGPLSQL